MWNSVDVKTWWRYLNWDILWSCLDIVKWSLVWKCKILGVTYDVIAVKWFPYIYWQQWINSRNAVLKTPAWDHVIDVYSTNLVIEWEEKLNIFVFEYVDSERYKKSIWVFSQDGINFFEIWDKKTEVKKVKETQVQTEVWMRKWLVKRVVDRVIHPKIKK